MRKLVVLTAACMAAALVLQWVPMGAEAEAQPGIVHTAVVVESPTSGMPRVRDGKVWAIVEWGNLVVVGGDFSTVREPGGSDIARANIFAFDRRTMKIDERFAPSFDESVRAIAVDPDGRGLFVGGYFETVNGESRRGLVFLDRTGQRVSDWSGRPNGRVADLAVKGRNLYVGGQFSRISGVDRDVFATLDVGDGQVTNESTISFSNARYTQYEGRLEVRRFEISPDGRRLVVLGNFQTVGGQTRDQVAVLDVSRSPDRVANWSTDWFDHPCNGSTSIWPYFVRDVSISPDSSYFAVATVGGRLPNPPNPCDQALRLELSDGLNQDPTWVSYSGGDSVTSVEVTGEAVYVGGHYRWLNNPYGENFAGPGAVARNTLAALDPVVGDVLGWDPGREPRGHGVLVMESTDDGLWIGHDTDYVNGEFSQRLTHFVSRDVDRDGILNGSDSDDDNDGVVDSADAFPFDATESVDSDGDGLGDNADAFPLSAFEQYDRDGDGVGDNRDVFPDEPAESADSDNDGVGDNADAFPDDSAEQADADGDGVGDNADNDADNDGLADGGEGISDAIVVLDNFESNTGWVINPNGSDAATTGIWERGNPESTSSGGVTIQLGSAAGGSRALVTGLTAGTSVGTDDIDNGVTSARSPAFTLPGNVDELKFAWTFAHLDNATNDDFLRVTLTGGPTDVQLLQVRGQGSNRGGDWRTSTTDVSSLAGRSVRVLVEAADGGGASLVEAAIDEIRITTTGGVDADGDGLASAVDLDSDNDSIADVVEIGLVDADGDFLVDDLADQGTVALAPDSDGDGTPDFLDLDSNNDGTFDIAGTDFAALDTNGDGRLDDGDTDGGQDANGNGVDDLVEFPPVPFECQVTGGVLTWSDQGVARYFVREINDGVESYLTTVEGATLLVLTDTADQYKVRARVEGEVIDTPPCTGNTGEPIEFSCAVNDGVLAWSDQGVSRYFVRRIAGDLESFVATVEDTDGGAVAPTNYDVSGILADAYIVRYRANGEAIDAVCSP